MSTLDVYDVTKETLTVASYLILNLKTSVYRGRVDMTVLYLHKQLHTHTHNSSRKSLITSKPKATYKLLSQKAAFLSFTLYKNALRAVAYI
jgi:hypothetical protein